MVSSVHNADFFNVHPALLMSTDDTTVFVFDGKANNLVPLFLHGKNTSAYSTYATDVGGIDMKSGLRLKLTFTMSALGFMAPLYVNVYGLKEMELPASKFPSGILVLEIPGLCYGRGLDPRLCETGYVIFSRTLATEHGENSVPTKRFKHYRSNVFHSFVSTIRSRLFGWKHGTPVPEDFYCVSWIDGGQSQLKAVANEENQVYEDKMKIVTCKKSASSTTVEQACDVSPLFRSIKTIQKGMTFQDVSTQLYSISEALKKGMNEVVLIPTKYKAVFDCVACLPSIVSKSSPTPKNLID